MMASKTKTLNWTKHVTLRLKSAGELGGNAKVMTEMAARAMVLEVLREYGITPQTEE